VKRKGSRHTAGNLEKGGEIDCLAGCPGTCAIRDHPDLGSARVWSKVLSKSLKAREGFEHAIHARYAAPNRRVGQNELDTRFAEIRCDDGRVNPLQDRRQRLFPAGSESGEQGKAHCADPLETWSEDI
jgi:hypothetical protein